MRNDTLIFTVSPRPAQSKIFTSLPMRLVKALAARTTLSAREVTTYHILVSFHVHIVLILSLLT